MCLLIWDRYESMIATLQLIDKDYGGVNGYLTKYCRLTHEDVAKIRRTLITGEEPIAQRMWSEVLP